MMRRLSSIGVVLGCGNLCGPNFAYVLHFGTIRRSGVTKSQGGHEGSDLSDLKSTLWFVQLSKPVWEMVAY